MDIADARPGTARLRHLRESLSGRRCLVTGHTGFKGAWLSLWLAELGAEVAGYSLAPPTTPSLFELAQVARAAEDLGGDIRDASGVLDAVARWRPEVVFHLAAQPLVRRSYQEPRETFESNVTGTVNVLDAVRQVDSARAVVVVTSDKCYEDRRWVHAYRENDRLGGVDPYSASKAAAELVAASYGRSFLAARGVGVCTARAGNVIGGGDMAQDRILPDAVRALRSNSPLNLRNPAAVRAWQHVLNPLWGYLLLADKMLAAALPIDQDGVSAWNFGPDPDGWRTVEDLVRNFHRAYGHCPGIESAPDPDAVKETHFLTLASDKARSELDWRPCWDFERGVRETARWYRGWTGGESPLALCRGQIAAYMEDIHGQ